MLEKRMEARIEKMFQLVRNNVKNSFIESLWRSYQNYGRLTAKQERELKRYYQNIKR